MIRILSTFVILWAGAAQAEVQIKPPPAPVALPLGWWKSHLFPSPHWRLCFPVGPRWILEINAVQPI